MADIQERQKSTGKKGLRRPKRRLGIRIDMTPMVDIAFLLLIFYMVTTIFAAPQAMEINLPPKTENDSTPPIKVKKSNLLNVWVEKSGDFYYQIGSELRTKSDMSIPWKIPADSLRDLFTKYNWDRPKLSTLFIIHPEAKYSKMVDLLDETEVVEALLRNNQEYVKAYIAQNPEEKTFSFRYALRKWEDRDDKLFAKVLGLSAGGM
ncbi:MAG: biopolymer transporter ExbD [candidate division Zixibacteria bacterium]|nr:biopolymer transporter ExbD [candidate division Zixibacteria bacterium]